LRVNKNLRKYNFFTNARDFDRRKLQKVDVDLKSLQISEIFEGQLSRLLRLDDRSAGCHGLEGRPIFLDNDLVNFALRLSPKLLIRNGWSKYLVRKYLSKNGLDFVAWNKRKIGFQAPEEYLTKIVWDKIGDSFKIDDFTNRIDSTNTRYIIYELTKLQMFKSH
jgi:asparagine synthase (glutamine-hydrolysing)